MGWLLKVFGFLWLAMGISSILIMIPRQGATGSLEWTAVAIELAAGVALLGVAFLRPRGWWPFRSRLTPEVESIFNRLQSDEGYSTEDGASDLLKLGRRADAIKLFREADGLGPIEAVAAVRVLERRISELPR